ncbi:MAG: isocitrate lyase/PEP mutase family protein, partial [Hyphomicrobiaceae bacterium]
MTARFQAFRDLHDGENIFVLANAWDVGSARMLKALGYEALATTSAGAAFVAGRMDGAGVIPREVALDHARDLVGATDLPVSADLEDGFGAAPEDVAETIRAAAAIGLAGCSIEDTTGDPDQPIFQFDRAVERIEAAVAVVKSLDRPFILTARAENFSYGRPDIKDTIARLEAFEACGADVLYAPELPDLDAVRSICGAVSKPVNVVAGLGLPHEITLADLAEAGVKRMTLGSSLARVAIGAMLRA